jgi:catechol 2,3-dioxygenase-like lactoylglutathione lyase family enzyme
LTILALGSQLSGVPQRFTTRRLELSACEESCRCPKAWGPTASGTVKIIPIDRYRPHSVKQHTAFSARTKAEVDAFYAAALKAGGTDNGAPGLRHPRYYAAFVLDPDRNNIEAVYRGD